MSGYGLEKKDAPGVAVDLDTTLKAQGTLDFILVKNIGERRLLQPKGKGQVLCVT